LSVPIIFGATLLEAGNLAFTWETLLGVSIAFIVGIISIKFLLNYIKRHDFSVFAIYRVIFALIILAKYFIRKMARSLPCHFATEYIYCIDY
jgi:undecaprenyl-diphosphatase